MIDYPEDYSYSWILGSNYLGFCPKSSFISSGSKMLEELIKVRVYGSSFKIGKCDSSPK
jgi:hypothetical protein